MLYYTMFRVTEKKDFRKRGIPGARYISPIFDSEKEAKEWAEKMSSEKKKEKPTAEIRIGYFCMNEGDISGYQLLAEMCLQQ